MRPRDAGFALVEVLVAFAIAALVLAGLYQLIAGAFRGDARARTHEQALALARAHLAAIGVDEPLVSGETKGTYATGLAWRLTVEQLETKSHRGRGFRVVLEPLDRTGQPLARLETFKLVPREP